MYRLIYVQSRYYEDLLERIRSKLNMRVEFDIYIYIFGNI